MDFGAVVLWMGLIFGLSTATFSSAQTEPFITSLYSLVMPWFAALSIETADLLIRKLAHFSEYFIFGVLVSLVLQKRSALMTVRQISLAIPLGIIYAISDELHQSFVPSRTASSMDVLLDTIGFIFGSFCFYTSALIQQAKTVHSNTSPPSQ